MYKVGDIVKCVITGFKEYGIFVNINKEYNGLIHISEISESFVKNVLDYGEEGDIISAKVIEVDTKRKQLKLSIKNINYKYDGRDLKELEEIGFKPLKKHLNIWINEKIKELNKFQDK